MWYRSSGQVNEALRGQRVLAAVKVLRISPQELVGAATSRPGPQETHEGEREMSRYTERSGERCPEVPCSGCGDTGRSERGPLGQENEDETAQPELADPQQPLNQRG